MKIVGLVAAHNEESGISRLLDSLCDQTVLLDRIIVDCDNCTDQTVSIVESRGGTVSVFETVDNRDKKAGALNQALGRMIPLLDDEDWVFIVDGDGFILPRFVESALEVIEQDPKIGAVGGVFTSPQASSILTRLQANEYTRYARLVARRNAVALVLSGTSTMVKVEALREVEKARRYGILPGQGYYNKRELCEDFGLTLALRVLGWKCVSPKGCQVHTDVMTTIGSLRNQRIRWQRGTIEALISYGLNKFTVRYYLQQAELLLGSLALFLTILLVGWEVSQGIATWAPIWKVLAGVFYFEHVFTARKGGLKNVLLASSVIPEVLYSVFLRWITLTTYAQALRRTEQRWGTSTVDSRLLSR